MRKRMRRGKPCLRMFKGHSPRKTPELDRIADNFKKAAFHISASAEDMAAGLRHVAQTMGRIEFVVNPVFGGILVGDTQPFIVQPKDEQA